MAKINGVEYTIGEIRGLTVEVIKWSKDDIIEWRRWVPWSKDDTIGDAVKAAINAAIGQDNE